MSGLISELLGASEPMFSFGLQELEKTSGFPGVDIRLSAEIRANVMKKSRELGLDPRDSTPTELYHGLLGLARLHDRHLGQALGSRDPADVARMIPLLKQGADKLNIPKKCWALRSSAAKRLLMQLPPKQTMRCLGYKSVSSMLKRENMNVLFVAMRFAESSAWYRQLLRLYRTLTPSDFEPRDIQIEILPQRVWLRLSTNNSQTTPKSIVQVKELGLVMLLPMSVKRLSGFCLAAFPRIIHYMNEIRIYSSFLKLQQVKPDFGAIVSKLLLDDPHCAILHTGQALHWRVLVRYFGQQTSVPALFDTHLQLEDLQWRQAEDVIYRIEPSLHFWHNLDWVGTADQGQAVSFNLMDIAASLVNNLPFTKRSIYHLHDSLYNELMSRYLAVGSIQDHVIKQLDDVLV